MKLSELPKHDDGAGDECYEEADLRLALGPLKFEQLSDWLEVNLTGYEKITWEHDGMVSVRFIERWQMRL